jgi:DNA-binding NarL/FixJ family response regulator
VQTSKFRVLVVDDFEPWCRLVCSTLQKQPDLEVVGVAKAGLEAIEKAAELKPDLILLDMDLPDLNGLQVAKRIREALPIAKVLFVSQLQDADVIATALNSGACGYLLKMDAAAELLPAIKATLQGQQFISRASNRLKRP